jgi:hypothetical protein
MAVGTPNIPKLFMNGNSLMANNAASTVANARYMSHTLYSNLLALNYKVALFDYSLGGQKQSEINTRMYNQINAKTCSANDVVVIAEITNDLGIVQTVTAQDAIDNLEFYVDYVKQFTQKYIVCTCPARDFSSDLVTLMPKIDTVNAWIRTEYNTINICDFAADTNFDTKAKASISPPYHIDKLHTLQQGKDIQIGLLQAKIEYFLNN